MGARQVWFFTAILPFDTALLPGIRPFLHHAALQLSQEWRRSTSHLSRAQSFVASIPVSRHGKKTHIRAKRRRRKDIPLGFWGSTILVQDFWRSKGERNGCGKWGEKSLKHQTLHSKNGRHRSRISTCFDLQIDPKSVFPKGLRSEMSAWSAGPALECRWSSHPRFADHISTHFNDHSLCTFGVTWRLRFEDWSHTDDWYAGLATPMDSEIGWHLAFWTHVAIFCHQAASWEGKTRQKKGSLREAEKPWEAWGSCFFHPVCFLWQRSGCRACESEAAQCHHVPIEAMNLRRFYRTSVGSLLLAFSQDILSMGMGIGWYWYTHFFCAVWRVSYNHTYSLMSTFQHATTARAFLMATIESTTINTYYTD